jgi:hypothetical protein
VAADSIYLQGGPCNGRTVSADQIVGGAVAYIACGGGYYVVGDGKRRPNGDLIFAYSGKAKPGPPSTTIGHDARALQGWGDLRRTINQGLPTALRRTDKLTRASLRQARRHRRVRG